MLLARLDRAQGRWGEASAGPVLVYQGETVISEGDIVRGICYLDGRICERRIARGTGVYRVRGCIVPVETEDACKQVKAGKSED